MKIILDIDDLSPSMPNVDLILKLKEHYPKLKITAFTIPADTRTFNDSRDKEDFSKVYDQWAAILKENPWIEIAPHGFFHNAGEMLCDEEKAKQIILAGENLFKHYEIPFVKIFKAPKWQMSPAAYTVLRDMGYMVAIDRNNPIVPITGLKTYKYSWSFEEPFPKNEKIVKGHGHMVGMENAIDFSFTNLLNMPDDAEFLTVSEYMEQYEHLFSKQQNGQQIIPNTPAEQIFRGKGTQRLG